MSARRDAIMILIVGIAISLAPAVWYPILSPGQDTASLFGWFFLAAFTVPPFVLVAVFRRWSGTSRVGAAVMLVLAGALVVFGQYAGLDPNDPSSTGSIELLVVPIEACVLVVGLRVLESVLQRAARRFHRV